MSPSGERLDISGTKVKVWIPDDFDTTATGTVSVNGSNVYTFNPGAAPEEPETPAPKPKDPAPPKKPKFPIQPTPGPVAQSILPFTPEGGRKTADDGNTAPTIRVDGDKPIDQTPIIPNTPTFSGVATPGAEIEVVVAPVGVAEGSSSVSCTDTADEMGNWQCTITEELREGRYTIDAVVTNPDDSVVELGTYEARVLGEQGEAAQNNDSGNTSEAEGSKWPLYAAIVAGIIVAWLIVAAVIRRRNSATS